ncbi:gluconate 5-dehydrogenase [Cereibacter changlensis JA139]|uniref:Gluconate 5-dehydrogenase n=2 Tax=Cereibacter changlensis TaxID=402884 RepID=A0A2T4JT43_9RHOB|nr:SDR family oxidoreductase [Cereibacter changlensis]PTE21078.1 gluconate 5-dehydrogenase [Cereibacter changlensis JA139]PZX56350.1 gluconate 5-dehydrogenase [Cereibacter changlensis]
MSAVFDLSGKVAIVTGAAMAAAGAVVTLTGRSAEPLDQVALAIREAGGQADCELCDVTRRADIDALVARVEQRHDRVDILVNNAGIAARSAFVDVTDGDRAAMVETHMTGPFMACRAVLPGMIARKAGKIINTVSVLGELGRPWVVPYASATGGLRMLTRALAAEVAGANVQVNGIGPGYFLTGMNEAIVQDPALYEDRVTRVPARRWREPDELGGTVIYLASKASDYMSGKILYGDGGLSASF